MTTATVSSAAVSQHTLDTQSFTGFEPLDANYLYCPNQFLDVCLPNSSRSAVRLVAYILDQTLGWLDPDGNPRKQNITVSYQQLIDAAGLSRGAIRTSIDEAVQARFIRCIQKGTSAKEGMAAESAAYALRWDESGTYHDQPESFAGFFTGEGHRTPIPNGFIRHVIPHDTLTVTKVVGTVLRHTVGYQNQFGGRRSQAPLSYRFIQEFAHIPDPKTLREALSSAIASRYIVCVEEGSFHPQQDRRRPATYAVNWHQTARLKESGSKNPAAERFKKPSKEKTELKDSLKQQPAAAVRLRLLRSAGFDEPTAQRLSLTATTEQIQQQIDWLPRRSISQNRLGMLRRAIEENWSEPERPPDVKEILRQQRERDRQQMVLQQKEERQAKQTTTQRIQHRAELEQVWNNLSSTEQKRIEAKASAQQDSETLRKLFRTSDSQRLRECLRQLDRERTHVCPGPASAAKGGKKFVHQYLTLPSDSA